MCQTLWRKKLSKQNSSLQVVVKAVKKTAVGFETEKEVNSMIRVMRGHLSERKPLEQGTEGKERGRESCAGEGEEASRPRKWQVQGPHVRTRSACLKKSK